jgi:hypothetical protein
VVAEEENALAARRVELHRGHTPATTELVMTLDTPVAVSFDRAVADTAEALKALGDLDDLDDLDVRRAKAVGVLADPQRALDTLTTGTDPGRSPAGTAVKPAATLWLHLDQSALLDLDTFPAPITIDGLGTVSSDLLETWLVGTTLIVRPVLDLRCADAVDAHDPPGWMADLVRLRDRHCVFPGCRRASRACDLDHIQEYVPPDDGGPPDQTRPENLAPLCRRHHRAKTHTAWRYRRLPDGSYRWTSPTGRTPSHPHRHRGQLEPDSDPHPASGRSSPSASVEAEAEGVARRVEEDPEPRARLVVVLRRTEGDDRLLAGVEVVDDDVEVHLLGHVLARPVGRGVGVHALEGEAVPVVGADVGPVGRALHLPVQHRAVEGREGDGIGAVEDEAREPCDGHAGTVPTNADGSRPVPARGLRWAEGG